MVIERLVGHRGQMGTHPENTLCGFKAAINAGAKIVECDIQLTQDGVPVVLHDDNLKRTAGSDISIFDLSFAQAQQYSVHYGAKFGYKYAGESIPSLAAFAELIASHPGVRTMVELKQESIDAFGLECFTQAVFPVLEALKSQVIIISFNVDVVVAAMNAGFSSGWVVEHMDDNSKHMALKVKPPFLITDIRKVDSQNPLLWCPPQGHRWQWMLYDVVELEKVLALLDNGVDLIETADIVKLCQLLS